MDVGGQPQPISKPHKIQIIILGILLIAAVILVLLLLLRPPVVKPTATPASTSDGAKAQLALFSAGVSNPTSIVSTGVAGDDRLFVLDQSGKIRIINSTGTVVPESFLNISNLVTFSGEAGLLGLAFSPHYATDGYFYVDYIDKNMTTVVARYHVSSDANTADTSTAQVILTQKQPYPNHNGGALAFGPDDYLYIAFGDGGDAGDPGNRAQDTSTWLGKLLRINVSKLPYTSPSDNPFIGQASAKPEIWDLGLRNPWRISFDRQTHELYIADVGQGNVEEINVEQPGKGGNNYGWRCYEGNADFKPAGCKDKSTYAFPQLTYDHTEGRCSITGGYVYRGKHYPDLSGKYFYADYCGGQVYTMQRGADGTYTSAKMLQAPYKISTFGQDNNGELYLADYATGAIYQIQDAQ